MLEQLNWADYAIIAILLISIVASFSRGFLREALSLVIWIAAFTLAIGYADAVAAQLVDYIAVPSVRRAAGFLLLLLATLIVGGLFSALVGKLVEGSDLGGTDRLLGVVFGLIRGVVVVVILVLLASLTPLPQDPWWQQSMLLPRFVELAVLVRDLLPGDYGNYFGLG